MTVRESFGKERDKIPSVFSVETQQDSVSFPFDERSRAGVFHVAQPASWNTAVDDNGRILAHDRILRLGCKHQILIASWKMGHKEKEEIKFHLSFLLLMLCSDSVNTFGRGQGRAAGI